MLHHWNQSLTGKIVGIEINKNIVTNNYSYAHLKSGIGILNIDIIVESVPSNAEIDILYTGFRPTMNLYINTVNSDGNHITIHINTNGIVQLYSNTPGKFGIRTQFIIVWNYYLNMTPLIPTTVPHGIKFTIRSSENFMVRKPFIISKVMPPLS